MDYLFGGRRAAKFFEKSRNFVHCGGVAAWYRVPEDDCRLCETEVRFWEVLFCLIEKFAHVPNAILAGVHGLAGRVHIGVLPKLPDYILADSTPRIAIQKFLIIKLSI